MSYPTRIAVLLNADGSYKAYTDTDVAMEVMILGSTIGSVDVDSRKHETLLDKSSVRALFEKDAGVTRALRTEIERLQGEAKRSDDLHRQRYKNLGAALGVNYATAEEIVGAAIAHIEKTTSPVDVAARTAASKLRCTECGVDQSIPGIRAGDPCPRKDEHGPCFGTLLPMPGTAARSR